MYVHHRLYFHLMNIYILSIKYVCVHSLCLGTFNTLIGIVHVQYIIGSEWSICICGAITLCVMSIHPLYCRCVDMAHNKLAEEDITEVFFDMQNLVSHL